MALTLASRPNARDLVCERLRPLEMLACDTAPSHIDTSSPDQAVLSTKVMRDLFQSPVSLIANKTLRNNTTSSFDANHHLWPLPQPIVAARAWMHHVAPGHDDAAALSRSILHPPGYQVPTRHYETAVMRCISLLRMQKAVQTADYYWDLISSPAHFFVHANIGSVAIDPDQYNRFGIGLRPSEIGLHTVTRRYLSLISSRLLPFSLTCQELVKVQQRQAALPIRLKWMTAGDDGVDQGGVAQEFFQEVAGELAQAPLYLLQESEEDSGFSWINPGACDPSRLDAFECLGAMMGLAVHNSFVLPVRFPLVFYQALQQRSAELSWEQSLIEGWPRKVQGLQNFLSTPLDDAGLPHVFEVGLPAKPRPLDAEGSDGVDDPCRWGIGIDIARHREYCQGMSTMEEPADTFPCS